MAEWLEFYAKTLELNVWTSATVESAFQDSQQKWNVLVKRHGRERRLQVNHLGQCHVRFTLRIHDGYSCSPQFSLLGLEMRALLSLLFPEWCVYCPPKDSSFDLATCRTRSRALYSNHPNIELQMTTVVNALWSSGRATLVFTAACCTF